MTLEDLNQHLLLRDKLNKAEELLAALRLAAGPSAPQLTGMPHAPGVKDKVGDLAVEIADLSKSVDALRKELREREAPIEAFIAQIQDDHTRLVFRLRFLRGLSWKEVSQILGRFTTESSIKTTCYRYFRENPPDGGKNGM